MRRGLVVLFCAAVIVSSCGLGAGDIDVTSSPTSAPTSAAAVVASTTTTTTTTSTTTTVPSPWPPLPDDGRVRALRTPTGIVVPVLEERPDEGYLVHTPCQFEAVIADGEPLGGAHVVIDPGHGGAEEPGAAGYNGLTEADLNLGVALALRDELEARGMTVVLTRESDFRLPIITRAEIATVLEADLFLSIHHNAGIDAPSAGPGSEFYFQVADPESRRLAGIMWEEVYAALSAYDIGWVAMSDAGGDLPRGSRGPRLLRRAAPPGRGDLGARRAGLPVEPGRGRPAGHPGVPGGRGGGVGPGDRALVRDRRDPGSGFNDPIFRGYGPSGAGRLEGCVDPPLQ